MAISDRTKAMLWGKAALRCAICREVLLLQAEPGVDALTGEICHIVARKPDGPRGDRRLGIHQLDHYDNLLLLCQPHHKLVDDHPEVYTTDRLREIKAEHEKWVETELGKLEPWDCNLSQFTYLNIPRLSILSAMHGYKVNIPLEDGQTLHSLGWKLNHVLLAFRDLFNKIHPRARELPDLSDPDGKLVGITFTFNTRFRTRNMPYPDRGRAYPNYLRGDLKYDPHIYKKFGGWKLVLVLDPRWVTTTTAYCEFIPSGGHNNFAGLCTIKTIDRDSRCVYATPLVIGIPKSPFDALFL